MIRLGWDCKTCSTLALNGRQTPSNILSKTNVKSDSVFPVSFADILENRWAVGPVSVTKSGSSNANTSSLSEANACHIAKEMVNTMKIKITFAIGGHILSSIHAHTGCV